MIQDSRKFWPESGYSYPTVEGAKKDKTCRRKKLSFEEHMRLCNEVMGLREPGLHPVGDLKSYAECCESLALHQLRYAYDSERARSWLLVREIALDVLRQLADCNPEGAKLLHSRVSSQDVVALRHKNHFLHLVLGNFGRLIAACLDRPVSETFGDNDPNAGFERMALSY